MNAREFFRVACDDLRFEVCTNVAPGTDGIWFSDLTAKEMLIALDNALILEESYNVTFWNLSLIREEYVYVTLEETHGYESTYLVEILAGMNKTDSLVTN